MSNCARFLGQPAYFQTSKACIIANFENKSSMKNFHANIHLNITFP